MNASHTVDVRRENEIGVINIGVVDAACERFSDPFVAADCFASSFCFFRCCSYACACWSLSSLNLETNCS